MKRRMSYSTMVKRRRITPTQTRRKTWYLRRKRRNNRRPGGRPTAMYMSNGFPDRMKVKLRYVDAMTWSVPQSLTSCPITIQTSLYSPRSSGGHQCMWYDQWTPGIYTNYRVYGVKYTLIVQNKGINESWYVATIPQPDATAETQLQTIMERKGSKWRMGGSVNGSTSRAKISGYVGTAKTCGISRAEVQYEDAFQAAYNANPSRMAYLNFYLAHNYAGTATFDATLTCTFYAELSKRSAPSAS